MTQPRRVQPESPSDDDIIEQLPPWNPYRKGVLARRGLEAGASPMMVARCHKLYLLDVLQMRVIPVTTVRAIPPAPDFSLMLMMAA